MSKRSPDINVVNGSKRPSSLNSKICNNYTGYCPDPESVTVDEIDVPSSKEEIDLFYKNYVLMRRPCKLKGVSSKEVLLDPLSPLNITKTLPEQTILQVERKVQGGFGSGEKRLKMSLGELMDRLKDGDDQLYLTTQYAEDDPDRDGTPDAVEGMEENVEDDDYDDAREADGAFGSAGDFSDAGSFDFSDTHDDFEDLSGAESMRGEDDDCTEIIAQLSTGPLTQSEAELRVKELYQPPMNTLIEKLPETPTFLNSLIPQQINLWVGSSENFASNGEFLKGFDASASKLGLGRAVPGGGSSSGLHHDHADNIYVPISGRKRFTLFSPKDAAKMYTVGTIRKVYASGVIDYARCETAPLWRALRDDGAIKAEVAKNEMEFNLSLTADQRQSLEQIIEADNTCHPAMGSKLDPPSFSNVIPTVVHLDKVTDKGLRADIKKAALEKWPMFFEANRLVVDLRPGEMLYLPTGWFHEVTSFGNDRSATADGRIHVAVNYWFVPPNGSSQDELYTYKDHYWQKDYERTKVALEYARAQSKD
ncbi:LAQU0S01e15544g1_1 [Lachancea quebecensis]|uniref:LAQU0S01e15544g1_1 n=1 Tax=Lachancea quebecensis TaxID=1654605 RepID=A0A0P1KQ82_9SACH|nr:LAQU0S01e15544g1_1 [Lachancea quebecensis]